MKLYLSAAVALFATPALAQTDAIARGKTLFDVVGKRVGVIDRVGADGSVRIIVGTRFVTLKPGTVTATSGKPTATLSKAEIGKP